MEIVRRSWRIGEAVLNVIGILGKEGRFRLIGIDNVLTCLKVVAMGIDVSNSEPICRSYAKFIEYSLRQHQENTS